MSLLLTGRGDDMVDVDGSKAVILKGCEGGDILLVDSRELAKAVHQFYDYKTATLMLYGMSKAAQDVFGMKIIPRADESEG